MSGQKLPEGQFLMPCWLSWVFQIFMGHTSTEAHSSTFASLAL